MIDSSLTRIYRPFVSVAARRARTPSLGMSTEMLSAEVVAETEDVAVATATDGEEDEEAAEETVAVAEVSTEEAVADDAVEIEEEIEEPVAEAVIEEEEEEIVPAIDDLSKPLVSIEKPKPKKTKRKPKVVIARDVADRFQADDDEDDRRNKGKQLVFDEEMGEVVVKRKRKGSRRRPEWEEVDDFDLDEF